MLVGELASQPAWLGGQQLRQLCPPPTPAASGDSRVGAQVAKQRGIILHLARPLGQQLGAQLVQVAVLR